MKKFKNKKMRIITLLLVFSMVFNSLVTTTFAENPVSATPATSAEVADSGSATDEEAEGGAVAISATPGIEVTFAGMYDADNTVVEMPYGAEYLTADQIPSVEPYSEQVTDEDGDIVTTTYTFKSWTLDGESYTFEEVKDVKPEGALTFVASYEESDVVVTKMHTVTFLDMDGAIVATVEVADGAQIAETDVPVVDYVHDWISPMDLVYTVYDLSTYEVTSDMVFVPYPPVSNALIAETNGRTITLKVGDTETIDPYDYQTVSTGADGDIATTQTSNSYNTDGIEIRAVAEGTTTLVIRQYTKKGQNYNQTNNYTRYTIEVEAADVTESTETIKKTVAAGQTIAIGYHGRLYSNEYFTTDITSNAASIKEYVLSNDQTIISYKTVQTNGPSTTTGYEHNSIMFTGVNAGGTKTFYLYTLSNGEYVKQKYEITVVASIDYDSAENKNPFIYDEIDEDAEGIQPGEVSIAKDAEWASTTGDNAYKGAEITFDTDGMALTTGSDIIIILDRSGSMNGSGPSTVECWDDAVASVNKMATDLLGDDSEGATGKNDLRNRVALITFSDDAEQSINFTDSATKIANTLTAVAPFGATDYGDAMAKATEYAADLSCNGRKLYIAFISDGVSSNGIDDAEDDAEDLTADGAMIYGISLGTQAAGSLTKLTTLTYKVANVATDLSPVLSQITAAVKEAATDAVITDVIHPDFKISDADILKLQQLYGKNEDGTEKVNVSTVYKTVDGEEGVACQQITIHIGTIGGPGKVTIPVDVIGKIMDKDVCTTNVDASLTYTDETGESVVENVDYENAYDVEITNPELPIAGAIIKYVYYYSDGESFYNDLGAKVLKGNAKKWGEFTYSSNDEETKFAIGTNHIVAPNLDDLNDDSTSYYLVNDRDQVVNINKEQEYVVEFYVMPKKVEEYEVSYNLAGGSVTTEEAEEEVATKTYSYGASVSITDVEPTREGYTFEGWTTSDVTVVDGAFTMPAADVEFEAQWEINSYTIIFEYEDETEYQSFTKDYNTVITVPQGPTKASTDEFSYTFAGWEYVSGVNGTAVVDAEYTITGDAVYKATYVSAKIEIPDIPEIPEEDDIKAYADNGVYHGTYDGEYHDVVYDVVVLGSDGVEIKPTSITYEVTGETQDTDGDGIPEVMDAGFYPVKITITVAGCKEPIVLNATAVVDKVKLTVKADDKTITYGNTVTPSYAVQDGVFVKEEEASVVASYKIAADAFDSSKLYTVAQSGSEIEVALDNVLGVDVLKNYTVEYEKGVLIVNPATFTPDVKDPEDPKHDPEVDPDPKGEYEGQYEATGYLGVYDAVSHELVGDVVALLEDDTELENITVKYLSVNAVAIESDAQETVPEEMNVGAYLVEIEVSADNYEAETLTVLARITPAPLTVTASSHTITYGDEIPTPTATAEGLQGADVDAFTFTVTTDASNVGTYATTVTVQDLANYTETYVPGEIEIKNGNFEPEIIIPDPDEPEYGDYDADTRAYDSVYDADDHAAIHDLKVMVGEKDVTAEATIVYIMGGTEYQEIPTVTNVGEYPVTIKVSLANYNDQELTATAKVTKAPLTVTASSHTITYGDEIPTPTATAEGLQGADVDAFAFTATTEATDTSNVGTYPTVVADQDRTDLGNYDVTYVSGEIVIEKATLEPEIEKPKDPTDPEDPEKPTNPDKPGVDEEDLAIFVANAGVYEGIYDDDDHNAIYGVVVYGVDGNLVEDVTLHYTMNGVTTDTIPTVRNVGEYPIIITVSKDNYEDADITTTAIVTPATITITVDDKWKYHEAREPELSGSMTGLQGDDTMEHSFYREAGEDLGDYVISANYVADKNYIVKVIDGNFNIREDYIPVEPTEPTPTEPTVPTTPVTPTTPVVPAPPAPVGPADEPVDEPIVEVEDDVVIEDDTTPLAPADDVEIEDDATPLAAPAEDSAAWALLNLILAILTVAISIILLIGYFLNRKSDEEEEDDEIAEDEEEENKRKNKGLFRLLSIIPAVVAVVVFILTEDMTNPMIIIDRWTLVMLIIALVQLVVALASRKKDKKDDEENEEAYAN